MDTNNKEALLAFRAEYELSGKRMSDFAKEKELDYWKVRYALRKALKVRSAIVEPIGFTKLKVSKEEIEQEAVNEKCIKITTSYGCEIIISL